MLTSMWVYFGLLYGKKSILLLIFFSIKRKIKTAFPFRISPYGRVDPLDKLAYLLLNYLLRG